MLNKVSHSHGDCSNRAKFKRRSIFFIFINAHHFFDSRNRVHWNFPYFGIMPLYALIFCNFNYCCVIKLEIVFWRDFFYPNKTTSATKIVWKYFSFILILEERNIVIVAFELIHYFFYLQAINEIYDILPNADAFHQSIEWKKSLSFIEYFSVNKYDLWFSTHNKLNIFMTFNTPKGFLFWEMNH